MMARGELWLSSEHDGRRGLLAHQRAREVGGVRPADTRFLGFGPSTPLMRGVSALHRPPSRPHLLAAGEG